MKNRLLLSLSIVSVIAVSATPVHALDYKELLRNYLDSTLKGNNLSPDQAQAVTKTNLNNRQAELEQNIEAGVKTGQLTPTEETELRNDLNQIAHHESEYLADGTLQDPEVVKLLDELNFLSSKIKAYMENSATTGTGNLSHDEWFKKYGGRQNRGGVLENAELRKAHIDSMQAEIDSSISQALSEGRISWNESRDYQNTLNKIRNDELIYLKDGRIDYDEEHNLLTSLRELRSKINSTSGYGYQNRHRGRGYGYGSGNRKGNGNGYGYGHSRHHSRNSQTPLINQRIADGISRGKLSRPEASELYRKENRIHSIETQLRNSPNLPFNKQRELFREMEDLTRSIDQKLLGI